MYLFIEISLWNFEVMFTLNNARRRYGLDTGDNQDNRHSPGRTGMRNNAGITVCSSGMISISALAFIQWSVVVWCARIMFSSSECWNSRFEIWTVDQNLSLKWCFLNRCIMYDGCSIYNEVVLITFAFHKIQRHKHYKYK